VGSGAPYFTTSRHSYVKSRSKGGMDLPLRINNDDDGKKIQRWKMIEPLLRSLLCFSKEDGNNDISNFREGGDDGGLLSDIRPF